MCELCKGVEVIPRGSRMVDCPVCRPAILGMRPLPIKARRRRAPVTPTRSQTWQTQPPKY